MSIFKPVNNFFATLGQASSNLLSNTPLVGMSSSNNSTTNHSNGEPMINTSNSPSTEKVSMEFVPMTTEMTSSSAEEEELQYSDLNSRKKAVNIQSPCDMCLYENNQVVLASHCCKECQLVMCENHLNKHRNDATTKNHVITENQFLEENEIEILSSKKINKEDTFEHHQLFISSDSNNLDVNNLTDEEEELLAFNQQDFIYWTNLLKKYPHFCNLIHTPLIVRKLYHNGTLNGSLLIDNKTSHTINVILSQVGPLHQLIIPPGRLGIFEGIGRVHFTIEVGPFDISRDNLISNWDKALPIVGSVCAGVAAGLGLAAGALAGIGLVGMGAAAAFGGVSTVATAPIVAGVAKTSTEKKELEHHHQENSELMSNHSSPQNHAVVDDDCISTASGSSVTSSDPERSKFKHWMKKVVPGMNWTYPNCFKRGIFADGHTLVVIKEEELKSSQDNDSIFEIEEKRIP
ncbi:hypothetical protein FDP41_010054 [Naegleria fowleri]|uniref:Uncharacterized protein n=1 Tax=Naegleria fowleri TaxID=5763 RepID=A0A6A5BA77_NAEFO|nr:uncharacterized protein FDP41_010054 [Naegleria fowleri]KAF0971831.1 hypothetical protein FDP41_010054 [Naegleria fowleri]CAG4711058.1 unnamed protein product [Naegleria fowleri]